MTCPLCGQRKGRRACPALGRQICATCCGTKRLIEIQCPSDCGYLAASREHPPAVAVRQHERDVALVIDLVRDLNDRQTNLFLFVGSFLASYQAPELQPLIDGDVAEAAGALAATFETASHGVIYDHRPASPPAERLAAALKTALDEAGRHHGSAFERDASIVLKRVQERVVAVHSAASGGNRRAFLEMLDRVIRKEPSEPGQVPTPNPSRLIVP